VRIKHSCLKAKRPSSTPFSETEEKIDREVCIHHVTTDSSKINMNSLLHNQVSGDMLCVVVFKADK
jgi:hypothetical protein